MLLLTKTPLTFQEKPSDTEADEIDPQDLEAASELYNKLNQERAKKMSIEIKVEKVWHNGHKYVMVKEIKALTKSRLPIEYLEGDHCYKHGNALYAFFAVDKTANKFFLRCGNIYPIKEFKARFSIIKKCGDRLSEINLKRMRDLWSGEIIFKY